MKSVALFVVMMVATIVPSVASAQKFNLEAEVDGHTIKSTATIVLRQLEME